MYQFNFMSSTLQSQPWSRIKVFKVKADAKSVTTPIISNRRCIKALATTMDSEWLAVQAKD